MHVPTCTSSLVLLDPLALGNHSPSQPTLSPHALMHRDARPCGLRLLELSDDDMERARVDLCQPKLLLGPSICGEKHQHGVSAFFGGRNTSVVGER